VALVHYPVINKNGSVIASAVTNLDLHDIARASKTFSAKAFYVVTPLDDQRALASRILRYWVKGAGAAYNPKRCEALDLTVVKPSLDAVVEDIRHACNAEPCLVATCARNGYRNLTFEGFRERLLKGHPHLLLFGTAWGLSDELLTGSDFVLDPIAGYSGYNHLSVRSAAAIVLDRLMGNREPSDRYSRSC